jgi:hypothetical protein
MILAGEIGSTGTDSRPVQLCTAQILHELCSAEQPASRRAEVFRFEDWHTFCNFGAAHSLCYRLLGGW